MRRQLDDVAYTGIVYLSSALEVDSYQQQDLCEEKRWVSQARGQNIMVPQSIYGMV